MSSIAEITCPVEQLFSDLKSDGINIDSDVVNKAKRGDELALCIIGWEYHNKKDYSKAMSWYRLSAYKDNPLAQNNIGVLYAFGYGVTKNSRIAMEWHLKAAKQNNTLACSNIGEIFERGEGVAVNKYKSLEWFCKSNHSGNKIKISEEQGIHLAERDKNKSIEQLILETEDILRSEREAREHELKEEIKSLKRIKGSMEEEAKAKEGKMASMVNELREARKMIHEMRVLKWTNNTLKQRLEISDNKVKLLEKENRLLRTTSEQPSHHLIRRLQELEKSNQNLEKLLGQERELKINGMELLKQKMDLLAEKEGQKRSRLEKENQSMKRELKRIKTCSNIVMQDVNSLGNTKENMDKEDMENNDGVDVEINGYSNESSHATKAGAQGNSIDNYDDDAHSTNKESSLTVIKDQSIANLKVNKRKK